MTRSLIIDDVQFDVPNVRQTALHVMKAGGCAASLDQEGVENHLKECALEVIRNGEHNRGQLVNVDSMQAYFVVEDFEAATFSANVPHRYEVNFFVRVGHRQER